MKERINVTRSSMPDFDEYTEEIKSLWDSRWLTNNGEKHRRLEEDLKSYLETDNVTLFTNGHLALEQLLAAFGLPKGSEVITTPFTFISTTHAIARNGLKPVFCDIRESDYTIDPDKIESLITERTSAIVPVHVYGNICDYKRIDEIAKKHGLKVIYDAAHAFGVKDEGLSAAMMGDASMFSFHATKVFNTIEGGMVSYRDPALSEKLDCLKNFGLTSPEEVGYISANAKMNEFQAAMGICNLRHIDGEIEKRSCVYNRYIERLSGINGIRLNLTARSVRSNFAYFPVLFSGDYDRDAVAERLGKENIFARKYFYPISNASVCYGACPEKTPVALEISENILTLPMYADLSGSDVDRICDIIIQK